MLFDLANTFSSELASLSMLLIIVNSIIHIIFAGAVAKDAGDLTKVGQKTILTTGLVWAFATLLGGVFVAAVYWLLHHSTLTRSTA